MNDIFEKCILSDNVPNMLLYGQSYLYDKIIERFYQLKNIKDVKINQGNLHYKYSDIHYEINCEDLKNTKDYENIFESMIKYKEYYMNINYKTIILYNCNNLKVSFQNKLRVIIEKYRLNCIFIFICHKLNRMIEPLKSRCILIRYSSTMSNYDKCKISLLSSEKNYALRDKVFDYLSLFDSKKDINAITLCKKDMDDYESHYHLLIYDILSIFQNDLTLNIFNEIKKKAYQIIKINIDLNVFLKLLLDIILERYRLSTKIKIEIVQLFANVEYKLLKSYKKIIFVEYLLLSLKQIIDSKC